MFGVGGGTGAGAGAGTGPLLGVRVPGGVLRQVPVASTVGLRSSVRSWRSNCLSGVPAAGVVSYRRRYSVPGVPTPGVVSG